MHVYLITFLSMIKFFCVTTKKQGSSKKQNAIARISFCSLRLIMTAMLCKLYQYISLSNELHDMHWYWSMWLYASVNCEDNYFIYNDSNLIKEYLGLLLTIFSLIKYFCADEPSRINKLVYRGSWSWLRQFYIRCIDVRRLSCNFGLLENFPETLIPQAARLILANAPKNRSDFVDQERSDSDDYDYVVTDDTDSEPEPNIPQPDYDNYVDDFRDSYGEYGKKYLCISLNWLLLLSSSRHDMGLPRLPTFCFFIGTKDSLNLYKYPTKNILKKDLFAFFIFSHSSTFSNLI